uniref:Iron complex transport system substrate-binding protein n=1 Tax=uncultured Bacteroidota bacterium TaxID=152509 RepID=H5SNV8_9BACT|nr:iron complex transport system substrate-binding protein [uncultured Bacteroidetes bacterium]
MRWASLSPEATQWLYALGKGNQLIGRSHGCVEPPSVQKLPLCTRPGVQPRDWEAYLAPYAPDFGAISTLRPEGLVAVADPLPPDASEDDLKGHLARAVGYAPRYIALRARNWDALYKEVQQLGKEVEAPSAAQSWIHKAEQQREKLRSVVQRLSSPPSVVFLGPGFPLRAVRGWATLLAEEAGLKPFTRDKAFGWETLLQQDPEVVVFSVPGGTLQEAGEALAAWVRHTPVQSLTAFRQKRLYAFKGTAGLYYPSPALPEAAEALYELAHQPSSRANRHIGRLWAPLL